MRKIDDLILKQGKIDLEIVDLLLEHNGIKNSISKSISSPESETILKGKYDKYIDSFIKKGIELNNNLSELQTEIKDWAGGKKSSTSIIIKNNKDEILLLHRSGQDSFHPNTWCLPGGGIDFKETIFEGARREVKEECGIDLLFLSYDRLINLPDINLYYFIAYLGAENNPIQEIILDNTEHQNYIWADFSKWKDMDLILDLKSHLYTIFNYENDNIIPLEENIEVKELTTISEDEVIIKKGIGAMPLGSVRHWMDGTYKKVSETQWEKLSEYSNHPKNPKGKDPNVEHRHRGTVAPSSNIIKTYDDFLSKEYDKLDQPGDEVSFNVEKGKVVLKRMALNNNWTDFKYKLSLSHSDGRKFDQTFNKYPEDVIKSLFKPDKIEENE